MEFNSYVSQFRYKSQINTSLSFEVIGLCIAEILQIEKYSFLVLIIVERSGKLSEPIMTSLKQQKFYFAKNKLNIKA